ncbi:AraC family transcriptional regulator [Kineosporia sp. J2-2]|uniref:AraC family transcriptional regulator n=1 Tax=Kineosporia corallincola TaxID=2835133 RepID=A0ABS5TQ68_9ACTN|nr:AraC family transcriptional regulator [Kineosporia corallincola]MBT0773251.1 AraC family transcriptional regulator [Kineosporia corallincola]
MDRISETVAATRAGRAVAVRNRYAGGWTARFPAIHGSGLHIVQHGSPWLIPEHGAATRLRPGDVVFVPRGPEHGFAHTPARLPGLPAGERTPNLAHFDVEFVSCCYHLDRGQVHESFAGLPDVITLSIDDAAHPRLRMLADLLGEHAATDRPGDDIALPAIVDLLLVHLLRAWQDRPADVPWPGQEPVGDPRIAHALRAVHADPRRPWTVQQLADLAGMSRATFGRRFGQVTGESPGAYLLRRRLDRAALLLRSTHLPLAAVARQLGYSTEFSFAAAFRREFGIAPGRFRQREHAAPTS